MTSISNISHSRIPQLPSSPPGPESSTLDSLGSILLLAAPSLTLWYALRNRRVRIVAQDIYSNIRSTFQRIFNKSACNHRWSRAELNSKLTQFIQNQEIDISSEITSASDPVNKLISKENVFKRTFKAIIIAGETQLAAEILDVLLQRAAEQNDWTLLEFILRVYSKKRLGSYFKRLSNIKINLSDRQLYSHKIILEHYLGDYFKARFHFQPQSNELNLIHINSELFTNVYHWSIFKSKLNINEHNFQFYLALAEEFQILPLKQEIKSWIIERIEDFDDLKSLSELVETFNLNEVKQLVIEKIELGSD